MNLSTRNLYILVAAIVALAFLLILWQLPQWQSRAYLNKFPPEVLQELKASERVQLEKNAADIENSTRLTIAQIVGGLALLAGLYFTYQNVRTAQENLRVTEQGKLTERFSKAVELLGSEKLDVRLGGIYALERIARDSPKDHWTVMEVLTAFVRENSHLKLEEQKDEKMREDIQAVMTVIGRRKWSKTETKALNLQKVNLSNCYLPEVNLQGALLAEANLNGANLYRANLSKARMGDAILSKSELREANLEKAYLFRVDLSKANLHGVNFNDADLRYSKLDKSKLYGADFKGADVRGVSYEEALGLTLEQILSATEFGYGSLPDELKEQYKERQKDLRIESKIKNG